MLPRRFDSLFTRLLLSQTLLALGLAVLFGLLFYVERNTTVARLEADRWAPALRQRLGLSATGATSVSALALLQQNTRPAGAVTAPTWAPRIHAFDRALREQGVPLQEVAVSLGGGRPTVWLQLPTQFSEAPGGPHQWIGLPGQDMVPNVPWRVFVALGLGSLLLVAASWWFTRRLTQPLRQLRDSMLANDPAQSKSPPALLDAKAAPELLAIASAHQDLVQRYRLHENERALLLAGVSHDLRSPLARIRMAAELLPDLPGLAPRRQTIIRNTQVADALVGSFLDHVRAGELPMNQSCDLAALAHVVAAAQERRLTDLSVLAPASLPLQAVNISLLERVMANLLDNAFVHGQTPVRLCVQALGAGAAQMAVGDAGAGIAAAQREVVMQAFARGDSARGSSGLGLGLATVARIAQRLGGEVSFDDADGLRWVRVTIRPAGVRDGCLKPSSPDLGH